MAHWLFKSEPSVFSFEKLKGEGKKGTDWSGIRNHSAKLNMMAMKKGEQAFFYHSNEGKAIVGIVEVIKTFYPDPSDESGKFGMVDIRAVKPLPKPVTLEFAKSEPRLAKMALVANSRLLEQPAAAEAPPRLAQSGAECAIVVSANWRSGAPCPTSENPIDDQTRTRCWRSPRRARAGGCWCSSAPLPASARPSRCCSERGH